MTNTLNAEEQIVEAIDWTSDCLGMSAGVKVSAERAVRYVKANYPGGWEAFVSECCTYVQLDKATDPEPQSGYTPCACRDCMDTTVSSDMTSPDLCDECKDAGCPSLPERATYPESGYWDCQRDDAYGDDNSRSCGCGGAGVHGVDHGDYEDA